MSGLLFHDNKTLLTSCTGIVYVTYNVHGISSVSIITILAVLIAQTIIRAQCTLCIHVNIAATLQRIVIMTKYWYHVFMYRQMYVYIYMFWKEERSKQGQTNNKAKQHSTPKAVNMYIVLYIV